MPVPVKLTAFAVALVATFGAAYGLGAAVSGDGAGSSPAPVTTTTHPGHGGHP